MTTAEDQARRLAEHDPGLRLLDRLISQVGGHARVQAVFGDPVELEGLTVIPVTRVRWGVGGGGGSVPEGSSQASGSGAGGGGGVIADPIGYIEITAVGANFRPIARSFSAAEILASAFAAALLIRAVARLRR